MPQGTRFTHYSGSVCTKPALTHPRSSNDMVSDLCVYLTIDPAHSLSIGIQSVTFLLLWEVYLITYKREVSKERSMYVGIFTSF